MERPPLDGLVETCIYVSDVARSRAFYQRVFGFDSILEQERISTLAVAPGQVLILFKRGGTRDRVPVGDAGFIPPHDGSGEMHFAFGVPRARFEDWKTWLEHLDIEIESVVDWPKSGVSLYFRDPDRLLVEIITPGMWPNY